jgi:hypothetical protein
MEQYPLGAAMVELVELERMVPHPQQLAAVVVVVVLVVVVE